MNPQEGEHPRVSGREIYPMVGGPADRLKVVIPVFTEGVINAVTNALHEKKFATGAITIETAGDNPQKLTVVFNNPDGTDKLDITLRGDWNQKEKQIEGRPLIAGWDGRFWRKENPEAKDPIAEEHDFILRDGRIGIASAGKNLIWALRLPKDEFPDGGEITKFVTEDGAEVKKGETVLCYIKKVEEVK